MSDVIVVDASAILEILLNRPAASGLADRILDPSEVICAPHLLDAEVLQVLRRYARTREISAERAALALSDHLDLPIARYPHDLLVVRAWEIRDNFTAYDALYVCLAEALAVPLITADAALARAAGRLIQVIRPKG